MILFNPWKLSTKLSKKGLAAPHIWVAVEVLVIAAAKMGTKIGSPKEIV